MGHFINSFNMSAFSYEGLGYVGKMKLRALEIEAIEEKKFSFYTELEETYQISTKELNAFLSSLQGELFMESYDVSVLHDKFVLMTTMIEREDPKDPTTINKLKFSFFSAFENAEDISKQIKALFGPFEKKFANDSAGMYVSWGIETNEGLKYYTIYNPLKEVLYNEAYPYIKGIEDYVAHYIHDDASVLLFMGKPGTGKTRFLRYVVQKMSVKFQRDVKVLYTMDSKVFSNDKFFIDFFTNDYDLLILEDIDLNLRPRSDGNDMMHKLLASTDGFIRNNHKKIVLTTNLTNVGDIDSALLREGRCFGKIESRLLSSSEASLLLKLIEPRCEYTFADPVSVAKVYQTVAKFQKEHPKYESPGVPLTTPA